MPSAVVIEQFPGLDLRADPGDAPGALDAFNVTVENGRVYTRPGSIIFGATGSRGSFAPDAGPNFLAMYPLSGAAPHLIVGSTGGASKLYAINTAGVSVSNTTIGSDAMGNSSVVLGTPTATYMYVVSRGNARRWDGTTWTTPGGTFPANPLMVGLSPVDNRLAIATAGSKLWFSDAGDPTTYGANNFVLLNPGDGEEINGMTVFNNQLFVFKNSKFFVFYGNSIDATGNPIFNYRTVNTGIGMHYYAGQTVCTGRDGVYFIAPDGIYKTTGGPPTKISTPMQPFFDGLGLLLVNPQTPNPYGPQQYWWSSRNVGSLTPRIFYFKEKVYAALPVDDGAGTANTDLVTLVYDTASHAWTWWGIDAGGFAAFPTSNGWGDALALYVADRSANKIVCLDSFFSTDADNGTGTSGAAIAARYRMPFENYGTPSEKIVRDIIIEGKGAPAIKRSVDFTATLSAGATATMTTVPFGVASATTFGIARDRRAIRGRWHSWSLSSSSGAWEVLRATANVTGVRRPSVVS